MRGFHQFIARRFAAALVTTLLTVTTPVAARASDADREGIRQALTSMFEASRLT